MMQIKCVWNENAWSCWYLIWKLTFDLRSFMWFFCFFHSIWLTDKMISKINFRRFDVAMLLLMLLLSEIFDVNWLNVNVDVDVNVEYNAQKLNVIIVDELISFIVWSN